MPNFQYKAGLHNVGSYQVSGVPYITGSTDLNPTTQDKITFPFVTRSVTVINHSSDAIRVHFNATGSATGNVVSGLHYIELDSDEDSISMDVKCKEIYVSAPSGGAAREYRVIASLTQIVANSMFDLTGSGLTE